MDGESTNCPNCGTLIVEYSDSIYMCRECGLIFCEHCGKNSVCPNCGQSYPLIDRIYVHDVNYLKSAGKIVGGRNKEHLEQIARNERFEIEMKERTKKAQERAMQESNRQLNEWARKQNEKEQQEKIAVAEARNYLENEIGEDGFLNVTDSKFLAARGCFKASASIKEVVIHSSAGSLISAFCFTRCENLKSVTIQEGIKKLSASAFDGCTNLEKVHLPESLEEIGDYAFYLCRNLKEINIPDGLQKIGKEAFAGCTQLKTLEIMPTVKTDPLIFYESDNIQLIYKPVKKETTNFNSVTNFNNSSPERNSERPLNSNNNAGCAIFLFIGVPASYGGYKFISWIYDLISAL